MKERPILFSGEMVRAILEGRKTMTRRVVKTKANILNDSPLTTYQPESPHVYGYGTTTLGVKCDGGIVQIMGKCPYGKPGDRLWVRETWQERWAHNDVNQVLYRADVDSCGQCLASDGVCYTPKDPWKPSIHMPRWASRILLEVVSVRVERLQDISRTDVAKEGMPYLCESGWNGIHKGLNIIQSHHWPEENYARLWDSLCTKEPEKQWDSNPWVWVIEFKRVKP